MKNPSIYPHAWKVFKAQNVFGKSCQSHPPIDQEHGIDQRNWSAQSYHPRMRDLKSRIASTDMGRELFQFVTFNGIQSVHGLELWISIIFLYF